MLATILSLVFAAADAERDRLAGVSTQFRLGEDREQEGKQIHRWLL